MRKYGRVDLNHGEIVAGLRAIGCSVQSIASVGDGVPDLLVGIHGINLLMEVKSGYGDLTAEEQVWHNGWTGQVSIVRSIEDAVDVINKVMRRR
jgi:hypothetical protein